MQQQQFATWWAILVGPCFALLLLGLVLARRFFPVAQILFDVTEPVLLCTATIIALALAGVMMQMG